MEQIKIIDTLETYQGLAVVPGKSLAEGRLSSGLLSVHERSSRRFHSVWTPFDILFLRNSEIGKKTAIWAGPPVNRLVPKII